MFINQSEKFGKNNFASTAHCRFPLKNITSFIILLVTALNILQKCLECLDTVSFVLLFLRTRSNANIDSDHYLIAFKIRPRISKKKSRPYRQIKYNTNRLRNLETNNDYKRRISEAIQNIENNENVSGSSSSGNHNGEMINPR